MLIRFNAQGINTEAVASFRREAGVTFVTTFAGEEIKFDKPEESAAVWAYFASTAPNGMTAPAMTDPTTSAATDARDREWEKALAAWVAANEEIGAYVEAPPRNPAELARALDYVASYVARKAAGDATAAVSARKT